jgi:quercetin dioxygenase-like cupin family protein
METMKRSKKATTSKVLLAVIGLSATAVLAQQPAMKRTVLHQQDLSVAGRQVVLGRADFPKGTSTGKHTHPGEESSYVTEGTLSIVIEGVPKTVKAGESFFVPAGAVHDAINIDAGNTTVIANYIVEKGKPVTTPVK